MDTLNSYGNLGIDKAYIITIPGNNVSEEMSARCQKSCDNVGMHYEVWPAFDGTSNKEIKIPESFKNQDWLKWIKIADPDLSISEVACALSHISLWAHCMTTNKPIVILEHDAIVIKKIIAHFIPNTIVYLGCKEQMYGGWDVTPTPPHGSHSYNYKFILRAHAYSIDPFVAKNLFSYVLKLGIHESLDMMIRADVFPIIQAGLVAYDEPDYDRTTITERKKSADGTER